MMQVLLLFLILPNWFNKKNYAKNLINAQTGSNDFENIHKWIFSNSWKIYLSVNISLTVPWNLTHCLVKVYSKQRFNWVHFFAFKIALEYTISLSYI